MQYNSEFSLHDLTLRTVLASRAKQHGSKIYLTFAPDGRTFTYSDMDTLSNRIANGLLAHGIGKGAHVSMLMENCPEFLLLLFGIGKIGAVANPVNAAARGEFLRYFLEFSDASVLVMDLDSLDLFRQVAAGLPAFTHVVILGNGKPVPERIDENPNITVIDYDSLLGASSAAVDIPLAYSDLLLLPYTSGTTGPSKLSLYPHAHSLLYGLSNTLEFGYREDDVAYACLPLYHTSALLGVSLAAMWAHASVVLTRHFSASRFWSDCRDHGITLVNALGAMADFLWSQPRSPADRDHKVRLCRLSPMPRYAREFEERFGLTIVSAYGASDFSQITSFTADCPRSKMGSTGRARSGIQIRIADEDDQELPQGETGEILVRSDNVWNTSMGYYKMPEATVASMRNMWFHTGDRGYLDADGFLYFVNRKKDAIRRRGENISSAEVERLIARHPAVQEAAVFPVQAQTSEDEVAATVVLKQGHGATELELIEFCVKEMPYYMVPRYMQVAADLPRTLSFRVQKFKLMEEARRNPDAWFDREKAGIVLKRARGAGHSS